MSRRWNQPFRLTALCAALSSVYGIAIAQDATVEELSKPESSISIGLGRWSNDRPQQGIYDGMREGTGYLLLDADVTKRNDETGTWLKFKARNLGLDTREVRGEWERQGNVGGYIEFSSLTRDNPYTFTTGLRGIGTTQVVSGAGAFALPRSPIELGTKRDLVQLGFFKNLAPGLDFRVNFKNEDKDGTRQWGRGGAPEFAIEPINSTTRQVDAKLEYTTQHFQLVGGYYGSWYDNAYNLVDTYVNAAAPASRYYLTLPLDNQAHQFYVNGGYNFTRTTRGTFKVQYTKATQDERLPTADIAGLSDARSPTSLGGRLDTTLVQLGLTSRPIAKLSLVGNLRYHDVRELTPQNRFVWAANCLTGTCVDNTPLSFRTLSGKLEGTYRLPMNFSVVGGVDVRNQDRTVPIGNGSVTVAGVDRQRYVPFRAELDETTYKLQLRRSMSETVNGAIAYLHSKRDGSTYTGTNESESDEINPIHIADRKRNKWRGTIDWTPLNAFSVQFNVEDARDKYGHDASRPFGLHDGSAVLYSIDATYAFSEQWQVTAWYSYDKTKATQVAVRAANGGAAAADKDAHLEDAGTSVGLGLRGKPMDKLKLGADIQWTKNDSQYAESLTLNGAGALYPTSGGVTVSPLSDIHNRLTRLKFFATYTVRKDSDVRFDFIHERWKTDDWSWMFANGSAFIYGTTTDGTTVTSNPKQTSNFISVRYIYKFN